MQNGGFKSEESTPLASPRNESGDVSHWLRNKDFSALREHLHKYRPILREMATSFGGPLMRRKVDRSDIVQDTLQDAVRGLPDVNAQSSGQLFAWLKTLLENRIRSTRRKYLYTAKRKLSREVYEGDSIEHAFSWTDDVPLPAAELIELENLERLSQSVARLPEELKLLLKWRFEDELTFKEIGERVNRSPDAVRMLVNRCLRRMREDCFEADSQQ